MDDEFMGVAQIGWKAASHYASATTRQLGKLLGHSDMFGNPLGLVNRIQMAGKQAGPAGGKRRLDLPEGQRRYPGTIGRLGWLLLPPERRLRGLDVSQDRRSTPKLAPEVRTLPLHIPSVLLCFRTTIASV